MPLPVLPITARPMPGNSAWRGILDQGQEARGVLAGGTPSGVLSGGFASGLLDGIRNLRNREPGQRPILDFLGDHSATLTGMGLSMLTARTQRQAFEGMQNALNSGRQVDYLRTKDRADQRRRQQQEQALAEVMRSLVEQGQIPAGVEGLAAAYPEAAAKFALDALTPDDPAAPTNVGDGWLWSPERGFFTHPGNTGPTAKPPNLQTIYDEQGNETKGYWAPNDPNAGPDGFVRIGGAKPRSGTYLRTNADGTVEYAQGVDPNSLTPTTRTQVQKDTINFEESVARLQGIGDTFKPEYTTLAGRLGNSVRSWQAWILGKDSLSPDEQRALEDMATWQSRTVSNLNQYLHDMSGAAITPAEAERLMATIPNPDDDPITFKAKLDDWKLQAAEAIERNRQRLEGQGQQGAAPGDGNTFFNENGDRADWNGSEWVITPANPGAR